MFEILQSGSVTHFSCPEKFVNVCNFPAGRNWQTARWKNLDRASDMQNSSSGAALRDEGLWKS
jgi:hypothetical protein